MCWGWVGPFRSLKRNESGELAEWAGKSGFSPSVGSVPELVLSYCAVFIFLLVGLCLASPSIQPLDLRIPTRVMYNL